MVVPSIPPNKRPVLHAKSSLMQSHPLLVAQARTIPPLPSFYYLISLVRALSQPLRDWPVDFFFSSGWRELICKQNKRNGHNQQGKTKQNKNNKKKKTTVSSFGSESFLLPPFLSFIPDKQSRRKGSLWRERLLCAEAVGALAIRLAFAVCPGVVVVVVARAQSEGNNRASSLPFYLIIISDSGWPLCSLPFYLSARPVVVSFFFSSAPITRACSAALSTCVCVLVLK